MAHGTGWCRVVPGGRPPKIATVWRRVSTKKLLTLRQVADRLAISLNTARALVTNNRLPHVRVTGDAIRVRPEDLHAFIAEQSSDRNSKESV